MGNKEIIQLKKEAWFFWKKGKLDQAVSIVLKLERKKNVRNDFKFDLVFSNLLNDDKKYAIAVRFFKRATKLKPSNELASNFLFVNFIECKAYNLAMNELKRYLSNYPAKKYYRTTLRELLLDLNSGYAYQWEKIIIKFSKKNNIRINTLK